MVAQAAPKNLMVARAALNQTALRKIVPKKILAARLPSVVRHLALHRARPNAVLLLAPRRVLHPARLNVVRHRVLHHVPLLAHRLVHQNAVRHHVPHRALHPVLHLAHPNAVLHLAPRLAHPNVALHHVPHRVLHLVRQNAVRHRVPHHALHLVRQNAVRLHAHHLARRNAVHHLALLSVVPRRALLHAPQNAAHPLVLPNVVLLRAPQNVAHLPVLLRARPNATRYQSAVTREEGVGGFLPTETARREKPIGATKTNENSRNNKNRKNRSLNKLLDEGLLLDWSNSMAKLPSRSRRSVEVNSMEDALPAQREVYQPEPADRAPIWLQQDSPVNYAGVGRVGSPLETFAQPVQRDTNRLCLGRSRNARGQGDAEYIQRCLESKASIEKPKQVFNENQRNPTLERWQDRQVGSIQSEGRMQFQRKYQNRRQVQEQLQQQLMQELQRQQARGVDAQWLQRQLQNQELQRQKRLQKQLQSEQLDDQIRQSQNGKQLKDPMLRFSKQERIQQRQFMPRDKYQQLEQQRLQRFQLRSQLKRQQFPGLLPRQQQASEQDLQNLQQLSYTGPNPGSRRAFKARQMEQRRAYQGEYPQEQELQENGFDYLQAQQQSRQRGFQRNDAFSALRIQKEAEPAKAVAVNTAEKLSDTKAEPMKVLEGKPLNEFSEYEDWPLQDQVAKESEDLSRSRRVHRRLTSDSREKGYISDSRQTKVKKRNGKRHHLRREEKVRQMQADEQALPQSYLEQEDSLPIEASAKDNQGFLQVDGNPKNPADEKAEFQAKKSQTNGVKDSNAKDGALPLNVKAMQQYIEQYEKIPETSQLGQKKPFLSSICSGKAAVLDLQMWFRVWICCICFLAFIGTTPLDFRLVLYRF